MLQPKDRFTSRASDYVRFRPGYPSRVAERLLEVLSDRRMPSAADIGSGTGILTRVLLEHGFSVWAVEPNKTMRRMAEESLSDFAAFTSVDGEAVRTSLASSSVNAVTAAQAFHWFAGAAAVREFDRILKPGGVVMIVWNDRLTECDEFHQEYEDLLLRFCPDYTRVNHRNVDAEVIKSLFGGWRCTVEHYPNCQEFDMAGLRGRVESSSYAPTPEEKNYVPMMAQLEALFGEHNERGVVRMRYNCVTYLLRRDW